MNKMVITNFKGYMEPTALEFSDITIQAGMNSVGKSTAVQALLLARQVSEARMGLRQNQRAEDTFSHWIFLNGPYDLHLGDYDQVMVTTRAQGSYGQNHNRIVIQIDDAVYTFQGKEGKPFFLLYRSKSGAPYALHPSQPLYYINAERIGPRNYQDINMNMTAAADSLCGYHGENTFDVISRYSGVPVMEGRRLESLRHVANFSSQLEAWMGYIIPGIRFRADRSVKNQTAELSIRQEDLDTEYGSPYNFGFGISYLLPIVVTGLLAEAGSIYIVENPEAHLHPGGQSRVGYFLAQAAFSGTQIIVETHSEHIINGVRLYALKHQISPDRICINNFSISDGKPNIKRLPLNHQMDILEWPDGFFDQEEKDLAELRHLRRKKT